MKILIISIGTRGDMEPMLAMGQIVQERGHQVICAFPEQFRDLAEHSRMEFASLGEKYIDVLDSDAGRKAMGGSSGLEKAVATLQLTRNQTAANKQLVHKQYELVQREKPDRIVFNSNATYPVIWEVAHPGKTSMILPLPYIHYVRDHAQLAFNRNLGRFLNKQTYALASFGMVTTTSISAGWLNISPKASRKAIGRALQTGKAIYTISPALFPRPDYWPQNLKVLGYHQRDSVTNWLPDDALTGFLARHGERRILFITFGSMTNPQPEEKTRIIVDILQRNMIPAIINTAAGGLVETVDYDRQLLHFVSRIPYEWIFPQVYAVIHHGGSGTTHLALKHGCASMIIPHIIDQYVWDGIIAESGAGPKGIKVSKLRAQDLEPKVLDLMNNRAYKEKAGQLSDQMAGESFRGDIYRTITAG